MDKIALLPADERIKIFRDASAKLNIPIAMVEKDFWVCWVMSKIFADPWLSANLLFKGGTSLSKAYNLIARFSEDLDIILAQDVILAEGEVLLADRSKSQRKNFDEDIEERAAAYINTTLKNKITAVLGDTVQVLTNEEYHAGKSGVLGRMRLDAGTLDTETPKESDSFDDKDLHVIYPKSSTDEYLRRDILLEIGIKSARDPNEQRKILPYVAVAYPELEIPHAIVPTVKAHRTFWDKATILHHEHHRPETKTDYATDAPVPSRTPARYSRHYYDLYQMSRSAVKSAAFIDLVLLEDVVYRKQKLFGRKWARYDLAKPGTFRLMPNEYNNEILRRDYQEMKSMIFGEIPEWEVILAGLQELENEINKLV